MPIWKSGETATLGAMADRIWRILDKPCPIAAQKPLRAADWHQENKAGACHIFAPAFYGKLGPGP
jgi:hypothetical protein